MKKAAQTANKIRGQLEALPCAFARTVVAHYIAGLTPEHKKDLLKLVKGISKKPDNLIAIPLEIL